MSGEIPAAVREAAERYKNSNGFCWSDIHECIEPLFDLAEFAVSEIARRDAEAVERGKAITDEYFHKVTRGNKAIRDQDVVSGDIHIGPWTIREVKTTGQLLDLLAALKGGGA